ncbi:MAG: hypothetical protein NVS2B8_07860 [Vulcanimicrobiaceae bacterium]
MQRLTPPACPLLPANLHTDGNYMMIAGFGLVMALTLRPTDAALAARAAPQPTTASAATSKPASHDVATLLLRLNDARRARGLAALVLDPRLCAIAERHGLDMLSRKYFAHVNPEGATPFDRMSQAHYRFGYAGENLALDHDAEAVHRALLASPEHRDNIVEPHYMRVGIASMPGTDGTMVVEDFSD